jgi:serine phosphatase RsbU (regulator of sigma subunit)
MKDKSQIKPKEIILEHNDILMVYSDGIVENRNHNGDLYGIDRLQNIFNKIATFDKDVNRIYEYIISDVQVFR